MTVHCLASVPLTCLALMIAAPVAAQPVALTAETDGTPFVFPVTLACGDTDVSRDFTVYEDAAPRPGAQILSEATGPMARAADPLNLAEVIDASVLDGSDCDLAVNLGALSPEATFLAATMNAVGARHAGARLATLYFGRDLEVPMPLEYADACLTSATQRQVARPDALRAAIEAAQTAHATVTDSPRADLDGQFMIAFNLAVFDLSKELAACTFDAGADAPDRIPSLLARAEAVTRLGGAVGADTLDDDPVTTSGDWRIARRGWGASALVRAESEPVWLGYACTLNPDGTFQWSIVIAAPPEATRATLQIDGQTFAGAMSGRAVRRFAGIDADFRYLNFGAASGTVFDAVRAARDMRIGAARASGQDIALSTRGSANALQQAESHCATLVAARAD